MYSTTTFSPERARQMHEIKAYDCPYTHGTIFTDPYPGGYVHGANPAICPLNCMPQLNP